MQPESFVREWKAVVDRYGSAQGAERYEEHLASEMYGLAREQLPAMLVFLQHGKGRPLRLLIPKEACRDASGVDRVADLLLEGFSKEALRSGRLLPRSGSMPRNRWCEYINVLHLHLEGSLLIGIQLDPTDELILRRLHAAGGQAHVTSAIARALQLNSKTIGKNLARLSKLGLLANSRRGSARGYRLTLRGTASVLALAPNSP